MCSRIPDFFWDSPNHAGVVRVPGWIDDPSAVRFWKRSTSCAASDERGVTPRFHCPISCREDPVVSIR